MASTALQLAREAAAAAGLEEPSTLTSGAGVQTRVLMTRGGRALAEKRGAFGQAWPEITRPFTVQLVSGQEYYALPEGFASLVADTTWDGNDYEPALGPASPGEWAALKGRLSSYTGPSRFYRIAWDPAAGAVRLQIDPVPGAGEGEITLEYASTNWVRPSASAAPSLDAVGSDAHVPVFPGELMVLDLEWRLRAAEGLQFASVLGEFEMRRNRIFAQRTGANARTVSLYGGGLAPRTNDVSVVNFDGHGG